MLPIISYYVTIRPEFTGRPVNLKPYYQTEEKVMSKALTRARPVIEATVISILLVTAAVAVPVAIVYATV